MTSAFGIAYAIDDMICNSDRELPDVPIYVKLSGDGDCARVIDVKTTRNAKDGGIILEIDPMDWRIPTEGEN